MFFFSKKGASNYVELFILMLGLFSPCALFEVGYIPIPFGLSIHKLRADILFFLF